MWQLAGSTVQWQSGDVHGSFSPSQPSLGVRLGQSDACLFALALDGQAIPPGGEHYIRGTDLFVDCPADERLIRIQTYYRDLIGPVPGIELVISVQTKELDVSTKLQVVTKLPGHLQQHDDRKKLPPSPTDPSRIECARNVFRWRDNIGQISGVQFVHPSDFISAQSDGQTLCCDLFPEPLENGVIRRGRVRCYITSEERMLDRLYQEFLDTPLPLTT